jgi:putative ABC transport system substrate-binding protein
MLFFLRLALAVLSIAGLSGARAQPVAKPHRVGIVSPLSAKPEAPTVRAFRQRLLELGYVEGKNVVIEARYAEGRPEIFPQLVAELLRLKVDVIVAGSGTGAVSAKNATSIVPIVFAGIADPVTSGIVTNFARPGGNVTGATYGAAGPVIAGKWVELLKEAVPGMAHAAVLFDSAESANAAYVREVQAAARSLKIRVEQFEAGDDATLQRAFTAIGASPARGLIVTGSAYYGGNRTKLIQSAADKRLPAIYFFSLFPEDGGLMSYGGSLEDSYRRAASQVDRILKGAKPGDLPIDQATKYELVINLKTAKALGIVIPRPLLLRADRVIE